MGNKASYLMEKSKFLFLYTKPIIARENFICAYLPPHLLGVNQSIPLKADREITYHYSKYILINRGDIFGSNYQDREIIGMNISS